MIIKSMSRKKPNFHNLIAYMEKGGNPLVIGQNLRTTNLNKAQSIRHEFIKNHKFCPHRKNGVALYHDIMSFSGKDTAHLTPQILEDLGTRYLAKRAQNALGYARVHQDKDHVHIHFMISGNLIESPQKLRLSKADFKTVKQELEAYQKGKYPFLKHSLCQEHKPERSISGKEGEILRKGKVSQKERVIHIFKKALEGTSEADFLQELKNYNLEIYKRGKNYGVLDTATQRKHRLKKLGLQEAFLLGPDRWQLYQKRTQEIKKIKELKISRQLEKEKEGYPIIKI